MCITCGCGTDSAHIVNRDHQHTHGNRKGDLHSHDHHHHGYESEHGHHHHHHESQQDHHHHHLHGSEREHNHNRPHETAQDQTHQEAHGLKHNHSHSHPHNHNEKDHQSAGSRLIHLERDILHENALLAARNRGYLDAKGILAINLVSSPGSGKTMLLERTLSDLKEELSFSVIEGDQQTTVDADRIEATGTKAVQINTGKGCHLDAHMVLHAIQELNPAEKSLLFIENVGNLVCPSMFDLGENERVVIISVTEGDDKPLKYPDMFHTSGICIINKIDLLPYVTFDCDKLIENAKKINPNLTFFSVSCTTGEGLDEWYNWLKERSAALKNG